MSKADQSFQQECTTFAAKYMLCLGHRGGINKRAYLLEKGRHPWSEFVGDSASRWC